MMRDIGAHTWQFDGQRFAEMVSPKTRLPGADPTHVHGLEQPKPDDVGIDQGSRYHFASNTPIFAAALHAAAVSLEQKFDPTSMRLPSTTPLAQFLQLCLEEIRSSGLDLRGSVYEHLSFVVYDRETEDGVEGASRPKPNLAGLLNLPDAYYDPDTLSLRPESNLFWSAPPDKIQLQLEVAVEVNDEWPEAVRQILTYARCGFSAAPLRSSVLAIGYNPKKHELRFILVHRGGLTSTVPFDLLHPAGRFEIVRILIALLLCKTRRDPGFELEGVMHLPVKGDELSPCVDARIKTVLQNDVCCRGRATHVYEVSYGLNTASTTPAGANAATQRRLSTAKADVVAYGGLGTLKFVGPRWKFSNPLATPEDGQESNAIVKVTWARDGEPWASLEDEMLQQCDGLFGCPGHHYSFNPISEDGFPTTNHLLLPTPEESFSDVHWPVFERHARSPPRPEYRTMMIHVSSSVGSSLLGCTHPEELLTAVLCGMLGWLGLLQKDFLHRDLSIGNMLRLFPAIEMMPFVLDHSLIQKSFAEMKPILAGSSCADLLDEFDYEPQAERLMNLLDQLGLGTEASGLIIDGDNAVRWSQFQSPRDTTRSGTAEFMSARLLDSMQTNEPILHAPVDDLSAIFNVTQWASAFHRGNKSLPAVQRICKDLAGNDAERARATAAIARIAAHPTLQAKFGRFLPRCSVFLARWRAKLDERTREYEVAFNAIEELGLEDNADLLRLLFFKSAYGGVADYVEVLVEWRKKFGKDGSENAKWELEDGEGYGSRTRWTRTAMPCERRNTSSPT
ncbi:Polyphosphoinositide phosphatase [Mycena chlorophos]|uniref:Polyphosphoinositide phosphatase n=1 Tax=Mycena chlorophos TaxID=658473 RepID=A0A8H6TV08_MYCCL|nr:Polyphosphoinositide phosphatase [Mycena chlorophos]